MREIATIEPLGGDDMELVGVAVFAVVLFVSFDTDVLSAAFDALAILPLPTAIIHDLPC